MHLTASCRILTTSNSATPTSEARHGRRVQHHLEDQAHSRHTINAMSNAHLVLHIGSVPSRTIDEANPARVANLGKKARVSKTG